jgi:hypothetical protein
MARFKKRKDLIENEIDSFKLMIYKEHVMVNERVSARDGKNTYGSQIYIFLDRKICADDISIGSLYF